MRGFFTEQNYAKLFVAGELALAAAAVEAFTSSSFRSFSSSRKLMEKPESRLPAPPRWLLNIGEENPASLSGVRLMVFCTREDPVPNGLVHHPPNAWLATLGKFELPHGPLL